MAVNISKTPLVNLDKNQTVCLTKTGQSDSAKLSKVYVGVSWGKIKRGGIFGVFGSEESVDLDASVICYDGSGEKCDLVFYGNKRNFNGSIIHSGDDLVGGGDEDDDNETVFINLDSVGVSVKHIVIALNSYSGQEFDAIPFIRARIYTGAAGRPESVLCAYNVHSDSTFRGKTSIILGHFTREASGWTFKADGLTGKDTRIPNIAAGIGRQVIM